jgi:periplasmic copper chaperone A
MRTHLSFRRAAGAAAGAVALVLLGALPAAAHIEVSSEDAAPGGFGLLVFQVPNESDTASTTKVEVQLPTDTPLASVSTTPMPGWTVDAQTSKLPEPVDVEGATVTQAVTKVTWTAEKGGGIGPDQFEQFELSVGPFPEGVDALSFPTTQTYSDGEVVQWNQPVEPGTPEAQEPENPAPLLVLSGSEEAGHSHGEGTAQATDAASSDTMARALGGIAVVLAAGALVTSLALGRRTRR